MYSLKNELTQGASRLTDWLKSAWLKEKFFLLYLVAFYLMNVRQLRQLLSLLFYGKFLFFLVKFVLVKFKAIIIDFI